MHHVWGKCKHIFFPSVPLFSLIVIYILNRLFCSWSNWYWNNVSYRIAWFEYYMHSSNMMVIHVCKQKVLLILLFHLKVENFSKYQKKDIISFWIKERVAHELMYLEKKLCSIRHCLHVFHVSLATYSLLYSCSTRMFAGI